MSQHLKAQTQELMGIVTSPNKNHRTGHGLVPVSQVEQIGNFLRHCRQCFDTHPLWFILFITFYYLTLIEILVGYLYVKRREQPSPQFSVAPKGDTNCNNFALFSSVHYVQYIYICIHWVHCSYVRVTTWPTCGHWKTFELETIIRILYIHHRAKKRWYFLL